MKFFKKEKFFLLPFLFLIANCQISPSYLGMDIKTTFNKPTTQLKGKSLSHYLSAMVYHRQGDTERAIQELEETLKYDPEATTPWVRLIRLYLMAEKYEQALVSVDKVIQKDKNLPSLYLIRGELCHRLGRIDDAVESFQKAIELNPEDVLGYSALLELQEDTNDLVAAIDIYRKMIEKRPNSALLHYQLGLTYARIKNNPLAITELEKSLKLDPRMIRAHYILALLYIDENQLSNAIQFLEQYVQKKPEDIKAWEVLLGAYARIGEMVKAGEIAQKMMLSTETTPLQKMLLSFFFLRNADYSRAMSLLPVNEYPLMSKLLYVLTLKLSGNNDFQRILETIDDFSETIDSECNDFINAIWSNFGTGIVSGWFESQIETLVKEGNSLALCLIWSRVLMVAEREEKAIEILTPLLKEHDKNLWVHYYLSICYDKLKQFENTEKYLKVCIELDPENAELLNFLGYLYADKNVNLTEAENLIRRALK
ncbi:MAG: tetratricopeptide repeat protein, partial [Candidatus Hydrogenedens sp.]